MFKRKPICEECGQNEATFLSFFSFPFDADPSKDVWKFVCECTTKRKIYSIPIENFFANPPATVDWMAHMNEKTWMNWNDFMNMMERFREATESFGA